MYLYVTQATGWAPPDGVSLGAQGERRLGLRDGMPFFLTATGEYEPHLNAWLRALPTLGARAPNTWLAYARDVEAFIRFLAEAKGGKHWLDAEWQDVADYHHVRQQDEESPVRVAPTTWNRMLAALERLYKWAVQQGLIERAPFSYTYRAVVTSDVARDTTETAVRASNTMRAPRTTDDPRYLTADEYRFFRDVGLRGLRPDGREDPEFGGRHGVRNALFADLLATTGMRRIEGHSLLLAELPDFEAVEAGHDVVIQLAAAVCKRANARPVYVPPAVYQRVLRYRDEQRAHAVAGRTERAGGAYPAGRRALLATLRETPGHAESLELRGPRRARKIATLTPAERRRLVVLDDDGRPAGPAMLWVGERGEAPQEKMWNDVFADASARTKAVGRPLEVTPHDLRHTYAVNLLSCLIRSLVRHTSAANLATPTSKLYTKLVYDPLRRLQIRLGHRSITSTYIYLDYLEEAQDMAHDAAQEWAGMLGVGGVSA